MGSMYYLSSSRREGKLRLTYSFHLRFKFCSFTRLTLIRANLVRTATAASSRRGFLSINENAEFFFVPGGYTSIEICNLLKSLVEQEICNLCSSGSAIAGNNDKGFLTQLLMAFHNLANRDMDKFWYIEADDVEFFLFPNIQQNGFSALQ